MSSRIIIKNLPKHLTPERFRQHFESVAPVTDAKIMKTPEGVSRKFGFIGFQTAADAERAIKKLNNSFIDTSRITIEPAKAIGDTESIRPWSKHSKGSSAYKVAELQKKEKEKEKEESDSKSKKRSLENGRVIVPEEERKKIQKKDKETDDKLQEFLGVIGHRSKSTWSNNGMENLETMAAKNRKKAKIAQQKVGDDDEDDEDDDQEEASDEDEEMKDAKDAKDVESDAKQREEQDFASNGRLFVRNISFGTTEEDLKNTFGRFGELLEVHIPIDPVTKNPKGFAYIHFQNPVHAINAMQKLDASSLQGRLIQIIPSRDAITPKKKEAKTFKEKQEEERKAKSGNTASWNSLFISSDAVANAVAKKLGVQKSELFGKESSGAATRMALAETAVIQENKAFLEEEGVDLSVLEQNVGNKLQRSKTVMLVKNIPFDTTAENLEVLFGKHGALGRVLIPPAGGIALVEFHHENEAKKAFTSLAYKKFQHVPLYLEWAPIGLFKTAAPDRSEEISQKIQKIAAENNSENSETKPEARKMKGGVVALPEVQVENSDQVDSTTLFVKNLAWETRENDLQALFEPVVKPRAITVAKRKDPKDSTKVLSRGFGFIEFSNRELAIKAIKQLQGAVLHNHKIQLSISTAGSTPQAEAPQRKTVEEKAPSTKVSIRNIPFEATKAELTELFKPFGEVRSVRIPRKFEGQHRGYGFVEFANKQEAANAIESLKHTHFYGRHLILAYAAEDDAVSDIRRKTIEKFYGK